MATKLSTAEPNAVEADDANAGYVYYRLTDGWIAGGDWSGLEESKKLRRGYQALHQYGYHDFNSYYVEHPFEPLFQSGGAEEMPVAQIVANGFHLHPPLIPTCGRQTGRKGHLAHTPRCWRGAQPVHFPQLEGLDLPGVQTCEYCGMDHFPTPQALKQHIQVMHNDRKDQEAIVAGIVTGLKTVLPAGGQGGLETLAELLRNPDALDVLRAIVQPGQVPAPQKKRAEKQSAQSERMRAWHAARKAAKTQPAAED
jgi:hypothetical protein